MASRDKRRADEYAKTWEIQRAYGSYEAIRLADSDVEAVYISLPELDALRVGDQSPEAGKHVLCEKPLSRTCERRGKTFDAAPSDGWLLSEAFMYRHNPQTKRAKQLVDEGRSVRRLIRSAFSYALYG